MTAKSDRPIPVGSHPRSGQSGERKEVFDVKLEDAPAEKRAAYGCTLYPE